MRPERVMRLPHRERIIDAAQELFFNEGITRVTVDAIAAKAESTKMTVYRHFESKDALVLEWIRLHIEQYQDIFERLAQAHPDDARAQLLGFARFIADDLSTSSYRGCSFTNVIAEIPDDQHPARVLIEAHKQAQFRRLATLCEEAGLADAQEVAEELTYLMEGAQIVSQNKGIERVGEKLLRMVRKKIGA